MSQEQKMGFEGLLYYGVAGTTANTLIPDTRDVNEDYPHEKGDTTARRPDGAIPVKTGRTTLRVYSCDFNCLNTPGNAVIAALVAAAAAGSPIAFRSKDFATGKGYLGDVNITVKKGKPLKGEQTLDFHVEPNRENGVEPDLHV